MPDTGAPWNIPYAQASDLVRDWPALSEDVAEAVADGLGLAAIAIGKNVVQTLKTDTFSTTSTSFVDITGMTVTITPTSASNKVLILSSFVIGNSNNGITRVNLVRNGTNIAQGADATVLSHHSATSWTNVGAISFVDSPASAAAVTYKLQMSVNANTGYMGRPGGTTGTSASIIMAIEVAA